MARSSITIESEYIAKIKAMGEKYRLNNKVLIQSMVDYFEFYNINPMDRRENIYSKLGKWETNFDMQVGNIMKTFDSFMRELDNKKLDPLVRQAKESTQALRTILKEQVLTKDDLKTLSLGGRRVAALDGNVKKPFQSIESNQEISTIAIDKFKLKANSSLLLYKNCFTELISAVSRRSDHGDYLFVSAINDFRDKVKDIPKIIFEGQKTEEANEVIEQVETLLRTIDNYCDEFLNKGQIAAGKDKLFYSHTIREYQYKFENIKII